MRHSLINSADFGYGSFSLLLLLLATVPSLRASDNSVEFAIRHLATDANEGIAAGDIDGDGDPDLVAGRLWYENPEWTPRPVRPIEDWNGYVRSNGDFLLDVNGDGQLDVLSMDFLGTELFWYENPGPEALRLGQQWPAHMLVDTGASSNEGAVMEDLDGDGSPELIINSWKKDVPMAIWRFVQRDQPDESGATLKAVRHQLGPKGNGHGLAVGDIDGDGKKDVVVGQGWYQQPADPWAGEWKFRPAWDLHASLPMLVLDVDADGDHDLILGEGHDFGLYWWENKGTSDDGATPEYEQHLIDRRYSQPHTLALADIDGDGRKDLVTGKRYFAHNGRDPGGQEPPCLYYYTWTADENAAGGIAFARHTIDEGHLGCGLQIVAHDLDGDSRNDLAVAGKSGTYVVLTKESQ